MNCFFLSTILILLVTAVSPIYADDDVTNISTTTQLVLKSTSPKDVLSSSYPTKELHALYEQWKDQFKREYDALKEEAMRKLIWLENHAHIVAHNDQMPTPSFTLGHNDFSDLTLDEFKKQFYLGEYSPGIFRGRVV